mmetsp:Transcript_34283/g.67409  ORF Transcript_34283/g.67409 Transcript_34283/m.67409 type:complete len:166 (+) Transcript_34283:88-585(+)|eukprot:CAMPEP_0194312538 /NCGR_PEP_ID=MMETSP0171-20130528/9459_1 /TAXON_ID=218684 /ORGANISM="Corethron pennatum, Strain L29A3" /LENGTH=165 /DNA_ID=CAMNT_0039067087 /DNA_START=54 /DNA_END=551 /DNA_ORIENTATION=+
MGSFWENVLDGFENAYGIRIEGIGSFLLAIAFVALASSVWPMVIKFVLETSNGLDGASGMTNAIANTNDKSSISGKNVTESISSSSSPEQQLAIIMEKNRELRRSMERYAKRLEENELLAAKLQAALAHTVATMPSGDISSLAAPSRGSGVAGDDKAVANKPVIQ